MNNSAWIGRAATVAAVAAMAGLSACVGTSSFEAACAAEGNRPGSVAYERCLDEAYAHNNRLISRYRSGGP